MMKLNLKKITKTTIPLIIALFVIVISIVTISFGGNIIESLTTNINFKESLSEERQANYNKMKIDYVNIKERITGTAPWNSGDTSNADGVDVSDKDDYVRTFDVLKYTVELGISPNKEEDGVTDTSTFTGGVIKVKATLPNQDDLILMTWEQDAWMQNVSYNDDKTEIYAEYHVPSGVSITNANQNLTFTVKVGGYKKEVTSDMQPEFEVWMEGNKPDNSSSTIESISVKDNKTTIISGHPSYDIALNGGQYLNQPDVRNDLKGNYYAFNISLILLQDVAGFSDLRGVEYPTDEISMEFDFNYYYNDVSSSAGSQLITSETPNAINLSNGTEIIAYGINGDLTPAYYPKSNVYVQNQGLPVGNKKYTSDYDKTVEDSGTFTLSLENNKIYASFKDFKLNGHFPTYNWWGDKNTSPNYNANTGYFAVGNIEFFTPYYNSENGSYDYSYNISLNNWTYSTLTDKNVNITKDDSATLDASSANNSLAISATSRLKGSIASYTRVNNLSQTPWYSGTASTIAGNTIIAYFGGRMLDGPYEGGTDHLFIWDSNTLTLDKYLYESQASIVGFPTYEWNLSKYYGIYKTDPENGIQGLSEMNSAQHEDFDWYETQEEAATHGKVTAMFIEDPDNMGMQIDRIFYVQLKTTTDTTYVGTTANYRHKHRVYGDKEKKQIYYYGGKSSFSSATSYNPTIYDSNGVVQRYQTPHELGESILLLGSKVSTNITVTDKDSSGNTKSAYDVQDGEMNFQINSSLSNGQTAQDSDNIVDSVLVKAYLPVGLSYKSGSANKEPTNVEVNSDGTTTITWEYNNWQINHSAPEYPNITFTAEISASLENNKSLTIKSTIYTASDLRNEAIYRTSSYGVVISNLAGSKALKAIDKAIVEKNESFTVTSTIGNTGQEDLVNVKTLEILPYNNDENGSSYSGSYTTKVTQIVDGQKIYYTTNKIASIGITEDKYGKYTIKDVDLATDSRWIEVTLNEEIPANATAMATEIPTILSKAEVDYVYEVIPTGNKEKDTYAFTLNMTSDNLQAAIKTNTVVAKVVERNISGKAFIDVNRNNKYDENDTLLPNNVVKLLDSNGIVIATTQTDDNGEYSFNQVEKGEYYIEFSIPTNYEVIDKGESLANSNGKTDLITSLNIVPTDPILNATNINLGIRKISSDLTVKYLEDGTNNELAPSKTSTVYYGDTYTTTSSTDVPSNYELLKKTDNYTGIVSSKTIEVIYYYQKKDSSLETSISKDGPESITKKDEVVKYGITYNAKVVDYIGTGTITIVDTLPYAIDEEKSSLDGGTYNADDKTITWIEEWTDIDTYSSKDSKEITKSIELVYLGIEGTDRTMINSITGNIKLDNNERDTESQTSTDIKIPGKIITHHYIKGTTDKLKDDVESTDLVGESFTSTALDIPGYIITKPETEEYVFTEEDQEVIYEYERIKLKVETVVNGIGGTIVGNEDVLYGDNSTKDFIIIKPDEGYVLGSVMINGVEVELSEEEKKQLILNNFENMTEDMVIQVTFVKETVPNPETGSFATFAKLLFAISLLILFYLYKHRHQNKVYKLN